MRCPSEEYRCVSETPIRASLRSKASAVPSAGCASPQSNAEITGWDSALWPAQTDRRQRDNPIRVCQSGAWLVTAHVHWLLKQQLIDECAGAASPGQQSSGIAYADFDSRSARCGPAAAGPLARPGSDLSERFFCVSTRLSGQNESSKFPASPA